MRGLLISFVLLAALAAAPVQGHEGEAHHAIPFTAVLGPAATLDVPLTFEEGPLEASWVFLLVAEVESNGTAGTMELRLGTVAVESWTLPTNGEARFFALLPETGAYAVHFQNPSASDWIRVRFYFDQSCNCLGKIIPGGFARALVVFAFDFQSGDTIDAVFNEPAAIRTRVTLATRSGPGATWPGAYTLIKVSEDAGLIQVSGQAGPVLVHQFRFVPAITATYYFFVENKSYTGNDSSPESYGVAPHIEITPATPASFPWAFVLIGAAAGVVILGFLYVRLRERKVETRSKPLSRRRNPRRHRGPRA